MKSEISHDIRRLAHLAGDHEQQCRDLADDLETHVFHPNMDVFADILCRAEKARDILIGMEKEAA